MKSYLNSTDQQILLFEKIPFLSLAILAILVLMAGRKVNIKPLPYRAEKVKHVLIISPDFYSNLMMDGAFLITVSPSASLSGSSKSGQTGSNPNLTDC